MSQTTATVTQEETNDLPAVGEKLAKKVMLDQSLGVVDEEEIDLDRVEVCLLSLKRNTTLISYGYKYRVLFFKLDPLLDLSGNNILYFSY